MKIVSTINEVREQVKEWKKEGKRHNHIAEDEINPRRKVLRT